MRAREARGPGSIPGEDAFISPGLFGLTNTSHDGPLCGFYLAGADRFRQLAAIVKELEIRRDIQFPNINQLLFPMSR